MLSAEARVPWWHWALLSLSSTVLITGVTLAGMFALAYRGVDVTEYIFLARPPYISDGVTALLLAGLLAAQTLGPVLVILLHRNGRALMCRGLCRSEDPGGMLLRLAAGAVATVLLQVGWSQLVTTQPAEHWRVAEHLIYAVVRGGRIWPVLWLVVTMGLVIPLAEELLFRGLIFGTFRRRWGFMAGALASAVMFGLAHGPAGAIPTALIGFYLAYQAERDGALTGAVALHALNNLGALVAIVATM